MNIPKKTQERLIAGTKRFQPILESAKSRDVNESDTVTIVADILAEIFGYDKYAEITSEFAIKGTYCDLAIKMDGKVKLLIEIKAIGLDLKDAFVKQAVDYAANLGVDWVILTTGILWRIYKIKFGKPIEQELIAEFSLLDINTKNADHLDLLYLSSKEGWAKSAMDEYHTQQQALSRFCIGALLSSDPILDALRKELRKMSPDVKIDNEKISAVLLNEVIKREIIESERFTESKKQIAKQAKKAAAAKVPKDKKPESEPEPPCETGAKTELENSEINQ